MNEVFPDVIVTVLLALTLGVSAWRTLAKGFELRKKEDAASTKSSSTSSSEKTPLIAEKESGSVNQSLERESDSMVEAESKFPWLKFFALVLMWLIVNALFVVRGGRTNSVAGIVCGTWQYWLLVASIGVFVVIFTVVVAAVALRETGRKLACAFPYLPSDIKWTLKPLILWPSISVIVGFLSAFVGIGGGMLQGPLLLEMGVLPAGRIGVLLRFYRVFYCGFY